MPVIIQRNAQYESGKEIYLSLYVHMYLYVLSIAYVYVHNLYYRLVHRAYMHSKPTNCYVFLKYNYRYLIEQ